MDKQMTFREFCERYRKGEFQKSDVDTQIKAGWHDWHCQDEDLASRLDTLWMILQGITSTYILDNYTVWFKNHCPLDAPLYDSIHFDPLDENKKDELSFLVVVGYVPYEYDIMTARNCYASEAGFYSFEGVQDFINHWEDALQDPTFAEQRAERDAKLDELDQQFWELFKKGREILKKYEDVIEPNIG